MGQSTPTTTMALDEFESRYAGFRAELAPREQVWFDELVCRARRHSNAINRRPSMDFERPVVLSMLLEACAEWEATRAELEVVKRQLKEVCEALADAGVVVRRPPAPRHAEGSGQVRLKETAP
ncbi:MAG TPA: hypothetical protein VGB42_06175 [Candidatus Thermoplasmatota archaeon]